MLYTKIYSASILPDRITNLYCKQSLVLFLFIFVLAPAAFCHPTSGRHYKLNNKKDSFIISGKVTQTSSYCGGAKPPQELLDRLATPVAYPHKKFYIRKGKVNSTKARIVTSFISDSIGTFSIRLAPGIYSIILEEQLYKIKACKYTKQYQQVDNRCLQQWWAKPYYLLEVKDNNNTELNFNFHKRCYIPGDVPCITYTGPLHP